MGTFGDPRRQRRGSRGQCGRKGAGQAGWESAGGPLRPLFGHAGEAGGNVKPDYKTAALCKQVRRVVGMTLAGECGDSVLQGLVVDDVLPAPNAGRLLVRVMVRLDGTAATHDGVIDVLQRLALVQGLLRARVGETLARKRTPELAFDVIPLRPAADVTWVTADDALPEEEMDHG